MFNLLVGIAAACLLIAAVFKLVLSSKLADVASDRRVRRKRDRRVDGLSDVP